MEVICSGCGHANEEDAISCAGCGQLLEKTTESEEQGRPDLAPFDLEDLAALPEDATATAAGASDQPGDAFDLSIPSVEAASATVAPADIAPATVQPVEPQEFSLDEAVFELDEVPGAVSAAAALETVAEPAPAAAPGTSPPPVSPAPASASREQAAVVEELLAPSEPPLPPAAPVQPTAREVDAVAAVPAPTPAAPAVTTPPLGGEPALEEFELPDFGEDEAIKGLPPLIPEESLAEPGIQEPVGARARGGPAVMVVNVLLVLVAAGLCYSVFQWLTAGK